MSFNVEDIYFDPDINRTIPSLGYSFLTRPDAECDGRELREENASLKEENAKLKKQVEIFQKEISLNQQITQEIIDIYKKERQSHAAMTEILYKKIDDLEEELNHLEEDKKLVEDEIAVYKKEIAELVENNAKYAKICEILKQ